MVSFSFFYVDIPLGSLVSTLEFTLRNSSHINLPKIPVSSLSLTDLIIKEKDLTSKEKYRIDLLELDKKASSSTAYLASSAGIRENLSIFIF